MPTWPVREMEAAAAVFGTTAARHPAAGASIDVAYADTRAGELSYAFGLARLPALKALRLALPGVELELRILGCSHQVLVGPADRPALSETVACLPSGGEADRAHRPLPAEHVRDVRVRGRLAWRYRMSSHVEALGGRAAELEALVRELAAAPGGVVGVFPGHPQAFTGLLATRSPAALRWESWHAYPQTDELVRTHSRLEDVAG